MNLRLISAERYIEFPPPPSENSWFSSWWDPEKMTPERLEQLRADLEAVVRERFAVLQAQWLDFEESNPEHEVVSDLRSYLVY